MAEINGQMLKLVIQVPCFNEEKSLGEVLSSLPRRLPGISSIEWLVIDDGSTDRTVEVARLWGVDRIIQLKKHQGLATAFMAGLREAHRMGADIIVNTDADNQYVSSEISELISPIQNGDAELVIGSRRHSKLDFLPRYKRFLYKVAARLVSMAIGQRITDPTSGFRSYSRNFAQALNIRSRYTYTIESIIFAAYAGYHFESIDILTNQVKRPSRLIRSIPEYILRSAFILSYSILTYAPLLFQRKLNSVETQVFLPTVAPPAVSAS